MTKLRRIIINISVAEVQDQETLWSSAWSSAFGDELWESIHETKLGCNDEGNCQCFRFHLKKSPRIHVCW